MIKNKEQQAESIAAVLVMAANSIRSDDLDIMLDLVSKICINLDIDHVLVEEYKKLMVNGDCDD